MKTFAKTFVAEWNFEFNGDITEVCNLMEEFRQNVINMPCENVSELVSLHGEDTFCSYKGEEEDYIFDDDVPLNWLKKRVENAGELAFDSDNCIVDSSMDSDTIRFGASVPAEHIVNFSVYQFGNCNKMDIYFVKYAKTIEIKGKTIDTKLGDKWHGVLICEHENTEKPYASCVTEMINFISEKNIDID
jgi:hypothetical protein